MTKPKDAISPQKSEGAGGALNKHKEIKKLIDMGVQRGFLTFVEVNELLPLEIITPEGIDEIMNLLGENEIEVIDSTKRPKDSEDGEESEETPLGLVATPGAEPEVSEQETR